jgi:NTP pyrophosphatase (non-canonical NTP hydrolase)
MILKLQQNKPPISLVNLNLSNFMTQQVDVSKYFEFVDGTTSYPSKDTREFVRRVERVSSEQNQQISRLLTGAVGLCCEGGEFLEIVKKILFQGKELTDENREHLIVELGDVFWYFSQACMALGVTFDEVVLRNTIKLSARYPEGEFSVIRSENRREGDI